jgi:hypothetical protein
MSRFLKTFLLSLIVVSLIASFAVARPLSYTFKFPDTGYIGRDLSTNALTVHNATAAAWGLTADDEYRGYLDFDTSAMNVLNFPRITKVEFYYGFGQVAVEYPGPSSFDAAFYTGEFLANGLDTGDWGAGDLSATYSWSSAPTNTWIDLGQQGINLFYDIYENYIAFDAPEHFSVAIRNTGSGNFFAGVSKCQLKVYYSNFFKALPEEESSFGSVKALFR